MKKRITVRGKALVEVEGKPQGVTVSDIAICTKNGMDIRIWDDDLSAPDAECYFYVKLELPWNRPDGSADYEEIVTDGDVFYIAFRSLGKQRLKWTALVRDIVLESIRKFVEELNK